MADQIFNFTPQIPAGTPIANPFSVALAMPPRIVVSIGIVVPPGPRGLMGFAVGSGSTAVIPATPGTWFVVDDYRDEWPLEGQISSGAWQFFGYNLGQYPHSVYLRFMVQLPQLQAIAQPAPLDFASINAQSTEASASST